MKIKVQGSKISSRKTNDLSNVARRRDNICVREQIFMKVIIHPQTSQTLRSSWLRNCGPYYGKQNFREMKNSPVD